MLGWLDAWRLGIQTRGSAARKAGEPKHPKIQPSAPKTRALKGRGYHYQYITKTPNQLPRAKDPRLPVLNTKHEGRMHGGSEGQK